MKELSIEQKVRDIEVVKQMIADGHISQDVAEKYFPELKEDEDELTWLKNYISEEAYSLSMDIRDNEDRIKLKKLQKSLAWLEKYAEKQTLTEWSKEDERERKRIIDLLEGWMSTFKETCYAEDCKCGIAWLKSLHFV